MTGLTLALRHPSGPVSKLRDASPLLWWTSLAFVAGFAVCAVLAVADPRLFNGISVWVKPAKFFLSLAIHMLTLSFGLMLLPETLRNGWQGRAIAAIMASMAVFEMVYIAFRAARAEASHFNGSSPLAELLYNLMGAGAAAMMVVTIWLGWRVLRHGPRTTLAFGLGWGLILSGVLTLVVGFTLGGMGSHWIGGDQTDATGLPLFGWSTTGGDLRVAHFIATHLAQMLPLVALLASRKAVVAAAFAGVSLAIATYAQALAGYPLAAL